MGAYKPYSAARIDAEPELDPGARRYMLVVTSGSARGSSLWLEHGRSYVIGRARSCDLRIDDPLVSHEHLRITVCSEGLDIRDLGSTNGSYTRGARFEALRVELAALISIGNARLRLTLGSGQWLVRKANADSGVIGVSKSMREIFSVVERVAAHDVAVLLSGETGTGKEVVAQAIHNASGRRGPFVVCDLAALSRTLLETELFGHKRGAFTSADRDGKGAFVRADGGTIFLDEIGELDPDLQPRLLRAIERREVKPVGEEAYRKVDVRIIAATNRDLTREVREGRFRADLYHRLAVVCLRLPPLRDRPEDILPLSEHFLSEIAATRGTFAPGLSPEALATLQGHTWQGNARELRNVLERAASLAPDTDLLEPALLELDPFESATSEPPPTSRSYSTAFKVAKQQNIDAWEREYLLDLLSRAKGNVSLAAQHAGLARGHLHRLLRKHALDA